MQFVDEALYDGGFDDVYAQMSESVRDVLRRAMTLGSERYRSLFAAASNYEWYVPNTAVLVEVLYRLGAVPLGRLDQDALGELYVSYVDEIDRDRLGQFFTPRTSSASCSTAPASLAPTGSSAWRETSGSRSVCSTSRLGRAASSWRPPDA